MNVLQPGYSAEDEETLQICFFEFALTERFYQKEAQRNDSTAQICVDCDVIWLQVNQ